MYVKRIGVEAIHPLFYGLVPPIIQGCKENGVIMNAWTVDHPNYIKALTVNGVDGIITNVPDIALEVTSQL